MMRSALWALLLCIRLDTSLVNKLVLSDRNTDPVVEGIRRESSAPYGQMETKE